MTPETPDTLELARSRIYGLTNRGAEICAVFTGSDERMIPCVTCGYTSDVHLIRDLLRCIQPAPETPDTRLKQFNDSCGALTWAGRPACEHPDRCRCQGSDHTPHKHYGDRAPHMCARCTCEVYTPAIPATPETPDGQTLLAAAERLKTMSDAHSNPRYIKEYADMAEAVRRAAQRAEDADTLRQQLAAAVQERERQAETERAMVGCVDSWMKRAEQAEAEQSTLCQQLASLRQAFDETSDEERHLLRQVADLEAQLAALQGVGDPQQEPK